MRDVTAGQGWQELPLPITTCCTFTAAYLANGHTYEFKVAATNLAGYSPASNVVSVRPLPPLPQPPTGLTASPGDGRVTLRWTATSTPNVWYLVEYRPAGGTWQRLPLPITTCCTFTAGYLANGTTYEFRVRSTNLAGVSTPSNVASARPMPPFPQAPTGLTATAGDGQVVLRWTASSTPNVWYLIEYKESTTTAWIRLPLPITTCCTFTAGLLWNGTTYNFRVRATNLAGVSAVSNTATARPMPPFPQPPSNLSTVGTGAGTVRLSWNPSSTRGVYYWVYYRLGGDLNWQRAGLPVVGTTVTMSGGFYTGEVYEFQVSAFNVAGESARTNIAVDVIPRQDFYLWRPGNNNNGSNVLAASVAAGATCRAAHGQRVCFNRRANLSHQAMTVGDYLLYPHSEFNYETQLFCEAYKRANIRWNSGRGAADRYGPNLQLHESVHSWQWSFARTVGDFVAGYAAASAYSYLMTGNAWQANWYETGANLHWGGYQVFASGRRFTQGGSSCNWLY
jgi:hypothetical protein